MEIKQYLLYAALSPMACILASAGTKSGKPKINSNDRKPNVIIIYADDLGYGDLQCFGGKNAKTPNVNKLADNGIRFTQAHAVAATSTPSRYSLLTGEYSWRRKGTDIAAGNAGMIIRPERYTMADMFKNCGYSTAAFGKWHLGLGDKDGEQDWNAPLPMGLADIGFDYSYIMAATADRVPCVFLENGKVVNYDESAPIYVDYNKPFKGEPLGKDHPELLYNMKASHGHDMAIVNGIGRIGYMKGGGKALWKDENIADSITIHAVNYIKQHKDESFFMYFATNDVHVPRFPNQRFRGQSGMGVRGDAIVQFDWCVGQLMQTLEKLGIADNTLIILSSDNGPVVDDGYQDRAEELLNGHSPAGPLRGNKYSAFEGGTRIPLIVSWPKQIKKAAVSDALVSQIDLFASLGSVIGAKTPIGTAPDSENNIDTWLGKNQNDRKYVIEQAVNHALSVRTKEWKYIEPSDGTSFMKETKIETGFAQMPQLYNVLQDVHEQSNVAAQHPEILFQLQNDLRQERKK